MIAGKKLNGLFISFIVGGAVGSAIALLYAPKRGKQLRSDISRKTSDLIDQGKKLTYDSWNGAKEAAESTFESANDFLNTGMEKIAHKTEKLKDAVKAGFNAYADERTAGNDQHSLYAEDSETPGSINMQYKGQSNLDFSSIMLH